MTGELQGNFLVIDVGTTGLRAAVVDDALRILHYEYRSNPPSVPFDGLVEFDASSLASLVLDASRAAVASTELPIAAVGITNQRASTVVWDRTTGVPIGPGLGWQDLRTITECIVAKATHDWTVAPNQSLTKLGWLLANSGDLSGRDLCFGTVDSWVAWTLSEGAAHVSDGTNMSTTTTGMRTADGSTWSTERLAEFSIDEAILPRVVDSAEIVARATALPGSPPIAAMIGDQQASLIGQGCVQPGSAKLTLGTGGMLDVVTGAAAPTQIRRNAAGTYALPVWQLAGELTWGAEAIMLSAGTNIEWLRDDLRIIDSSAHSHDVAQLCESTDGVVYVPALLGIGTPVWDYGARGALLGLTRGTERRHIVRAVLEGIAHRSADLLEAAIADTGVAVETIHVDGGMSANQTMIDVLADVTGRRIEVSPTTEATTRGAAFLAGLALGRWDDISEVAHLWTPTTKVAPAEGFGHTEARTQWTEALTRAETWHPDLSALEF